MIGKLAMKALRASPPQGNRRAPGRDDRAFRKWLRRFAAIYVAVLGTALMGAVAVNIDVSRIKIVETQMQNAAAAMGAPRDLNWIRSVVIFSDVLGHTIYVPLRGSELLSKSDNEARQARLTAGTADVVSRERAVAEHPG